MKPKHLAWTVNRKTEAKVKRKGFTLITDYASTAHMVQGMTLAALLADCGDAFDNIALKDMLAAYVTLSRVRVADGLLLLRAFSKYLFRQGPPPGPHCLMRLLRAKSGQPREKYSPEDARSEYEALKQARDEERSRRKADGHTWTCFDCGLAYTAPGFGARADQLEEVYKLCMKPGCWLVCTACAAAHGVGRESPGRLLQELRCVRCGAQKTSTNFEDVDAEILHCRQCELQHSFRKQECSKCHKEKPLREFPEEAWGAGDGGRQQRRAPAKFAVLPMCLACCPEDDTLACTVCGEEKNRR